MPGVRTTARVIAQRALALLVILALTAGSAELVLSLPILRDRYSREFRYSVTPSNLNIADSQRFFAPQAETRIGGFDADLGWDRNPVVRNHAASKRFSAQSYGDSFTEGAVPTDDTWQAHFERLTGQAIMNLGVGGYGVDQAVLKFEKYGHQYKTRLAILGLYNQMFRRALSYHSVYYFRSDNFLFAFKPIFVRSEGGFILIRPPCADASCLVEILSNRDHEVWQRLAQYDYWYRANEKLPVPGFPNTIKYARAIHQIFRKRRELQGAGNYFFPNTDSLDVTEYLVERFTQDSRELGMAPVCVMLYSANELRLIRAGIRFDRELLTRLTAKGIPYVDTARYILDHSQSDDDFVDLSIPDGHLNGRGNLMVAEALAQGLAAMALLGD